MPSTDIDGSPIIILSFKDVKLIFKLLNFLFTNFRQVNRKEKELMVKLSKRIKDIEYDYSNKKKKIV